MKTKFAWVKSASTKAAAGKALAMLTAALFVSSSVELLAVSPAGPTPASVALGKRLFEQRWVSQNPRLGSDGLGPLFNSDSCLGCHNQGGVGGGGEAKFNAKTVGIEKLQIVGGDVSPDILAAMVKSLHPGFEIAGGTLINTCAISHFGGSNLYDAGRSKLLSTLPAEFADEGGSANASEVRRANAFPITYQTKSGDYTLTVQARLFQRNTTALYGAGLLDQVPDLAIKQQANAQKKHPEISGRPSTLRDGRFGKFGWRGNLASLIDFTDQACANEVGLRTNRRPQPSDPTNPSYRNPAVDISTDQVRAMRDFLAALPAPSRRVPAEPEDQLQVRQGEQLFASVGCAVCHVPNLGPATGAYTDLLLHEMGAVSMDLNHAEPYVRDVSLERVPRLLSSRQLTGDATGTETVMGAYYGPSTEIQVTTDQFDSPQAFSRDLPVQRETTSGYRPNRRALAAQRLFRRSPGFEFVAPQYPSETILVTPKSTEKILDASKSTKVDKIVVDSSINREEFTRSTTSLVGDFHDTTDQTLMMDTYLRVRFEPTKFNEEWRTPPLWGVADSAPYMHDGRAETLLEAITMHDGEAAGTRDRFLTLPKSGRDAVLAFLETMVAPVAQPLTSVATR